MVAAILDEVHVLFHRLREAEKKHPERVVKLPRCASIDDPPRIVSYAGEANEGPSEESRTKGVPRANDTGRTWTT